MVGKILLLRPSISQHSTLKNFRHRFLELQFFELFHCKSACYLSLEIRNSVDILNGKLLFDDSSRISNEFKNFLFPVTLVLPVQYLNERKLINRVTLKCMEILYFRMKEVRRRVRSRGRVELSSRLNSIQRSFPLR